MDDGHAQPSNNFRDANDGAIWPAQPVQLARGRQPRDALAKTISYNVSSMDEFETSLREYLSNPPEQPEHTEAQLSFWIGTSFMVLATAPNNPPSSQPQPQPQPQPQQQQQQQQQAQPPPHLVQQHPHAPRGYQPANGLPQQFGPAHAYGQSISDPAIALTLPNYAQTIEANDVSNANGGKKAEYKVSLSIMEALQTTSDPKEKMRKQRAIAKCCVDAIQRIDGYRYSFHNCWNSREDDSFRFSYYCNDSLLNKDRAANGKGAKLGKRATKPVYDCKGVLSIKFSATKQALDVFYKHVPIHKTYEERAPPPRKDSKRRKYLEENDPEALARIATRPKAADSEEREGTPQQKKTKAAKPEPPGPLNTSLESDLRAQSLRSLLELIQVDPSPPEPTPPEPPPPPPPPPPLHPQHPTAPPQLPPQQVQSTPAQRRRPRNSCDVCKAKKTKCDGTRPICQTCVEKKRQCFYSESPSGDDLRRQIDLNGTIRQAPAQARGTNTELSELEKMKKELDEAKARIQELESEKRASTTPVQTPQLASRPQSQPQAQSQPQSHHRPQLSQSQSQSQSQTQTQTHLHTQQRQVPAQSHRQQLQQLNQSRPRTTNSPKQLSYNLDTPPQQQRVLNAQPSLQTSQQQIQPTSQMQSATPQLQVAAQQLNTGQQPQMQTAQGYFTNTHTNHSPYATMNRTLTQGSMTSQSSMPAIQNPLSAQNAMAPQSNAHLPQSQPQPQPNHQLHAPPNTGLTPTATPVDANNPYGRNDFAWPPTAYYGYQSAQQQQQQQQQDQWAAARGSGVFR